MEPPAAPVLVHLLNIEKLTNQGAPGFGPNTGTTPSAHENRTEIQNNCWI